MGWFGKIVGGGIGALVGGPAGAAVGFGVGALLDKAAADGDEASAEGVLAGSVVSTWGDEVGTQLIVRARAALPESARCACLFFDERERPLRPSAGSGDQFRTSEGELGVPGVVTGDAILAFLPSGAMPERTPWKIYAVVHLFELVGAGSVRMHGRKAFLIDAPRPRPWCQVELIEPLVLLAMRVARADGVLSGEEVRRIRGRMATAFELDELDLETLRETMKSTKPWMTNVELLDLAHRRLPAMEPDDLLELLAAVVHADGRVLPSEVKVIRELVEDYYSAAHWGVVESAFGLGGGQEPPRESVRAVVEVDHWAVLGVSRGATRAEIKKAYHAKMLDYHPDRVASLAHEFQELAHQKTIEIRTSYEALLRIVG